MSHVLKSSFSAVAILASAFAFSACAKNSDSPKSPAAPVVTPELKADIAASACPEIIGTYQNPNGDKIQYSMGSVPGGVSYTVADETTIVDGKPQAMPANVDGAATYVASCKDGVLTRTTRNAAGEVLQTANISVSKETGEVQAEMTTKGVTEHFTLTRVSAIEFKEMAVPEIKAEDLQPVTISESVKSFDLPVVQSAEEKSETTSAPAAPAESAVEAQAPAKAEAVEAHAPRAEAPYVRGFSRGPHFPIEPQY